LGEYDQYRRRRESYEDGKASKEEEKEERKTRNKARGWLRILGTMGASDQSDKDLEQRGRKDEERGEEREGLACKTQHDQPPRIADGSWTTVIRSVPRSFFRQVSKERALAMVRSSFFWSWRSPSQTSIEKQVVGSAFLPEAALGKNAA
jgi:hypothetical protein